MSRIRLAAVRHLSASTVPIVIGARGWATGAGMSLLMVGDIVIRGEFVLMPAAYPAIGVTPTAG